MDCVLVIDFSSILDFNKYYIFDKFGDKEIYSKLTGFLLSKIKLKEIVVIDKVYGEIRTNKYTESLKKAIKPYVVDTFFLFSKVEELIDDNIRDEIIRLYNYSPEEVENLLVDYREKHADLFLVAYCNHLKEKGHKPILVTEETFTDDKKIIEKLPTICKKENIRFEKVCQILFNFYKNDLKFDLEVLE